MAVSQIQSHLPIFQDQTDFYGVNTTTQKLYDYSVAFFKTIVFPIGILNLVAASFVLIAQNPFFSYFAGERAFEDLRAQMASDFTRRTLITADGVHLDAMEMQVANADKWIIFCNPNGATYEEVHHHYSELTADTNANLLFFNYRGTGESRSFATCPRDLYVDGETALQYALSHTAPGNVLMYGWSLGGSVAAEVASNHPGVHLLSDRSFARLTGLVSTIINGLAGTVLSWLGWEMNPVDALPKITGEKVLITASYDTVIPPSQSIATHATTLCQTLTLDTGHMSFYSSTSLETVQDAINSFL